MATTSAMTIERSVCAMRARSSSSTSTRTTARSRATVAVKKNVYSRTSVVVARAYGDDDENTRVKGRMPQEGDRVGDREDPDLYIGTYSNFFTDPAQIKGVVVFCAFLLSFFSLGNIGAAILLPILYGTDDTLGDFCIQSLIFGYLKGGTTGRRIDFTSSVCVIVFAAVLNLIANVQYADRSLRIAMLRWSECFKRFTAVS